MRNIKNYEKEYKVHEFEKTMVEFRRNIVIDQLKLYKPKKILEIGCGMEPIFNYYNNYNEITVIEPGNNFYENLIKIKSKHNSKKIIALKGFVEEFESYLKSKKFDFIIISSLLHEIKEPEKFIDFISSFCKNAVIHINVPNKNSFHRILALNSGLISSLEIHSNSQKKLQQNDFFDINQLENIFINANFKILQKGSYFIKPFTHNQMQQIVDENIINKEVINGLNKLSYLLPENGAEIFINTQLTYSPNDEIS